MNLKQITVAVPTEALAGLYGYEFNNIRFIPFKNVGPSLYDAILFFVRTEAHLSNWIGYSALNCLSDNGSLVISAPEKLIKYSCQPAFSMQEEDDFYPISLKTRLNDNKLHVEKIFMIPDKLTKSYPKGKRLLICKKSKTVECPVLLYNSFFDKNDSVLIISSFSAMIEEDSLWFSHKSLKAEFNHQYRKVQSIQPKQYADKQYHIFSPEIKFRFELFPGIKNKRIRAALLGHSTGKRISDELESGLASSSTEEARRKIELLPYRDDFRERILMDLFSSTSLDLIQRYSLKTSWYINRAPLQEIPGYNDVFCKEVIFCINKTHLPFICPYTTSVYEEYYSAYKTDLYNLSEKDEQMLWQQLRTILSYLSRRFNIRNPIPVPQASHKRMPAGAQSGRNMIATRSFSKKQTQSIWKYIEKKDKEGYLYKHDPIRILIAIRFTTGLPLSEILALEWGHILISKEYGTHLLYISGMVDEAGNRLDYSDIDPDRARIIAIPEELFTILNNRHNYLKQRFPSAALDQTPIVIDSEPRSRNRKQFNRMSIVSAANVFRKTKEKVSNGKRIVELESIGIEINYADYGGDLFNKNHEYYALKYGCNPGSLKHMYGFLPDSTVERYYIDYENEAILNQTAETLNRWICSLKETEKDSSSMESITVQNIYTDRVRLHNCTTAVRLTIESANTNNDDIYLTVNSAHTVKVNIR